MQKLRWGRTLRPHRRRLVASLITGVAVFVPGVAASNIAATGNGHIAFVRSIPTGGPPHVWAMTKNGDAPRRLLRGFQHEVNPSWSADGRRLVFGAPSGLWVSDANGRGLRRIGPHSQEADWAPDGKRVVLVGANTKRFCTDLYVMNVATLRTRRLTATRTCETAPSWSPTGGWIAFKSQSEDATSIVLVRPSGSARNRRSRRCWFRDLGA